MGLSPIFDLLREALRPLRHRLARFRARQVLPTAPARLLIPRAIDIANTRNRR